MQTNRPKLETVLAIALQSISACVDKLLREWEKREREESVLVTGVSWCLAVCVRSVI